MPTGRFADTAPRSWLVKQQRTRHMLPILMASQLAVVHIKLNGLHLLQGQHCMISFQWYTYQQRHAGN